MGGSDLADIMVALYCTPAKSHRWYLCLFWQMADIAKCQKHWCAKAQKAQGIQAGGCRCCYLQWKEEGKAFQGRGGECAQPHQMLTKANNPKTHG